MLQRLNELGTPVKFIIMIVLAAAIGGAGYYFVVMPVLAQNQVDQGKLDAKNAENAELRQFETKLPDLDRQIAQLKSQMEYQKQIVPDEKEVDNFIILLQDQAGNAGIQLRHLDAKPVANKEFYTEVPFGIEVDGPFYGVLTFFEKLAGQTRIVNVNDLAMKSTAKGAKYPMGPNDSVTVTATAKTFFSREMTPAPAVAAKPVQK